jgi:tRNA dimethylallyltransferase
MTTKQTSASPPLVVLVGQTGSGKSALAIELARRFNGEIISADSRAIYKGMDIGTAKPSVEDQAKVPHHLIDVVTPNQPFTVADFQRLAREAIAGVTNRGRVPFLVGGTGLYVDSVIYDFSFRRPANPMERQRLQAMTVEELQREIEERGLPLPENEQNPVHLIRTLETEGEVSQHGPLRTNTLVLGLTIEKDKLERRIQDRVEGMVAQGFTDEVRNLSSKYGWDVSALQAPGYKEFRLYLAGEVSLEETEQQFVRSHLQYAKRQKTWFKRNADIIWISNSEEAVDRVTTFLNN